METIQTNWKSWLPGALLVVFLGSLWLYPKTPTPVVAPVADPYPSAQAINTVPTYSTPAPVAAVATLLGIDLSHLHVTYGDTTACVDGDYANPISCFDPSTDSLYFSSFNGMTQKQRDMVVAHEFMHHVWYKMPVAEQNALVPSIQATYTAHSYDLNNRLTGYTLTGIQRTDELHSFECTEMVDLELPANLRAHCAQYVPNRNALPSLY